MYHGPICLSQELVDHIINMLSDDLQALKACSLTCKGMFALTLYLIHRTLYLRNGPPVQEIYEDGIPG